MIGQDTLEHMCTCCWRQYHSKLPGRRPPLQHRRRPPVCIRLPLQARLRRLLLLCDLRRRPLLRLGLLRLLLPLLLCHLLRL